MKTKNKFAVGLGRKSWASIKENKTPEEIFAMMSSKKKGKKKTPDQLIPSLTMLK